jgi:hypothetical protein
MQIQGGTNNNWVNAQNNPFFGTNQYLNQNIDATLGDVARNFNQSVRPAQIGANVTSGSFGNSGLAEIQALQENDLQRQMGNIASGMRMQDYSNQQQLAEAAINRNLGAQQFNAGLTENNLGRSMQAQMANLGTAENNLARQMATQQFNAGLGESQAARDQQAAQIRAQYGEEAANRFMQAQSLNANVAENNANRYQDASRFNSQLGQDWASRNDAMYQNWMGNQLQAMGMDQGFYSTQRGQDLQQAGLGASLFGLGTQGMLDQGQGIYNLGLTAQQAPWQSLTGFANVSSPYTGFGSTTQNQSGSTAAGFAGGAILGNQLYNTWR